MRALQRLLQVESGAPDDDGFAVVDEVPKQVIERQDPRLIVDDGQEDDPEGALHGSQRVELVQDDLGVLAALQLDDDPDAVAVRLVPQVGDPLELFLVDELGDPLDQLRLVDLVGDFREDDRFLVPGTSATFSSPSRTSSATHSNSSPRTLTRPLRTPPRR